MNWAQLLRNPWVWGGAGVAGVAGLALYMRGRKGSGSGPSDTPASDSPATTPGGIGVYDSTGVDVAHWLGAYSANLDSQFAEFKRDLLEQVGQLPTEDSPSGAVQRAGSSEFIPVPADPGTVYTGARTPANGGVRLNVPGAPSAIPRG